MTLPLLLCGLGLLWLIGFARAPSWRLDAGLWFWVLCLLGLFLRAAALALPPYEEIDFYRYFWDGRQALGGFSPYANPLPAFYTPAELNAFAAAPENQAIWQNIHPETRALSTIYAPLAVGVFAMLDWLPGPHMLAYGLSFLAAEAAAIALLHAYGNQQQLRLGIWALALNPLLLVTTYNGLHFDIWLLPLLLGWGLALTRGQALAALCFLLLAVALRHWPALLIPLTLLSLPRTPRIWAWAVIALLACALAFLPQLWHFWAEHSGLRVYGREWQMNSFVFVGLKAMLGSDLARTAALAIPLAFALAAALWRDRINAATAALLITGSLLLLSPTFFAWYWLWLLAFLILSPHTIRLGFASLAAFLPLYYLRFYFEDRGREAFFDTNLIWIEFAPPLLLILWLGLYGSRHTHHPRPE